MESKFDNSLVKNVNDPMHKAPEIREEVSKVRLENRETRTHNEPTYCVADGGGNFWIQFHRHENISNSPSGRDDQ